MRKTRLCNTAALIGAAVSSFLTASSAIAQDAGTVSDFSGLWERKGPMPSTFLLPEGDVPGPVWDPQDHTVGGVMWLGDTSNPILKPHAVEAIEARNTFLRNGGEDLPPYSLCWPSGVPQVMNMREPLQLLQTPEMVTIIFQRDHQVRRIYLNVPHSENLTPSWYGESIGHYEGDNTLVVTTIGQTTRTEVDKFGTPHSEHLRVVERFVLSEDRQSMNVEIMVEDPETFNMPWHALATYRTEPGPYEEVICAENNKNASTGEDYPIPINHNPPAF
jgi:hypothetical protein